MHNSAQLLKILMDCRLQQEAQSTGLTSPFSLADLGRMQDMNLGSRILTDAELQSLLTSFQNGQSSNLAANVDLFAQAANFKALEDLGLPKLQSEPAGLFQVAFINFLATLMWMTSCPTLFMLCYFVASMA